MAKISRVGKKRAFRAFACATMLALGLSCLSSPILSVGAEVMGAKGMTKYYADYDSLEETLSAAEQLTEDTAAEGDVLLKNQNKALPMRGNEWISVFGVSADSLIGAAPTGGQSTASAGGDKVADVLADAGFKVNPTLKNFYDNQSATIGQEEYAFNGKVTSSFSMYSDAAVVVLARTGGEGSDAKRVTSEEAGTNLLDEKDTASHVALAEKDGKTYKHYLMLTDSERALIKMVEEKFDKVVVVLNTSNAMEIEELRDDENIDAIINIDRPGEGGLAALGKILKGDVNPSGGLVDEWYTDFTADPTWYNFGNNDQTGSKGAGSNTYMNEAGSSAGTTEGADGTTTDVISDTEGFHGIDYEEGIYLGYKYYETYYHDMYQIDADAAQQWWEENVTYAFGYGLSYTTFSFKSNGIYTDSALKNKLTAADQKTIASQLQSTYQKAAAVDTLYLPVTVTNTGSVAGKKTVQVYVSAPYETDSVVEKASVSLVGFAKTGILDPGESQTVVVSVNVQDMASWYSYYAQSDKVTKGAYIMESGEYTLRIMEDSHYDCSTVEKDGKYYVTDSEGVERAECYAEESFTLEQDIALEKDDYSGLQVSSLFTDGVNNNGEGMDKDTAVDESHFGNIRTKAMMKDQASGMTTMTRNAGVSATDPSVVVKNDKNVASASIVNYTGASVPTKPSEVKSTVNGFDLSFPKAPTAADLTFKDNVLDNWSYWDNYAVSSTYTGANDATKTYNKYYENDDDKGYVWSHTSVPTDWSQAKGTLGEYTNAGANGDKGAQKIKFYASSSSVNTIKFSDMAGADYNDEKWTEFLNQLTYDELCQVNTYCGYGTVNIDSVGKKVTVDRDGPNSINQEFQACAESLQAATWNTELAEKRGIIIGNIALITGFQGWYAPGADIHRSPFSGRNNEYFSQDGILGGYIGAALTQGVQSKGIICYAKHTLMNDQETDRGCLFTWCDEQAMRENYMKNFQMIFQEGGSQAGMTAYGRLAGKANTNNTNLSVELYQNEWGSHAYFVTDGYIGWNQRTNPDIMVRAGAQTILTTGNTEYLSGQTDPTTGEQPTGGFYKQGETLPDGKTAETEGVYIVQKGEDGKTYYEISYTQWYCVREMAHNVLYQVANSAGQFNGYGDLELDNGKLEATESLSVSNVSVSIESKLDKDSTVRYSLTGALPEGLTFDENTGTISGTPKESGTFNLTVNYVIDGWINKSATYVLTVDTAIQITAESSNFTEAAVGTEFYAEFTSDVYTSAEYNSITYSLKEGSSLPDGLTLNADGTITGSPEKAGTYTFTVVLTAKNEESGTNPAATPFAEGGDKGDGGKGDGGKGDGGNKDKTAETTFVIVVKGETTGGDTDITIEDLNDKISDLESTIKDLQNSLEGNTSSGCGSSVTGGAALVGAVVLLGATICMVVSRKKKN